MTQRSRHAWHDLSEQILAGGRLSAADGLALLRAPEEDLLDILGAAWRVRHRWFRREVHLNFLVNAKSGLCGEDCGYCSQSRFSDSDVPRYRLLTPAQVMDGARVAVEQQAGTYCIVTSGRNVTAAELDVLVEAVSAVKRDQRLQVCVSTGLLSPADAQRLKDAGVDRVNHNLNTSRRYYPSICSTHRYEDRLATLAAVRAAGMEICSGGIVGMGETDEDVVDLALTLGELAVEAVPVNFFLPIPGTRIASPPPSPRYCLKALALFRLANPRAELRMAAGREVHLGPLQPLGLYAANSMFVGDYLTTKGQPAGEDFRMVEALGFVPVAEGAVGLPPASPPGVNPS